MDTENKILNELVQRIQAKKKERETLEKEHPVWQGFLKFIFGDFRDSSKDLDETVKVEDLGYREKKVLIDKYTYELEHSNLAFLRNFFGKMVFGNAYRTSEEELLKKNTLKKSFYRPETQLASSITRFNERGERYIRYKNEGRSGKERWESLKIFGTILSIATFATANVISRIPLAITDRTSRMSWLLSKACFKGFEKALSNWGILGIVPALVLGTVATLSLISTIALKLPRVMYNTITTVFSATAKVLDVLTSLKRYSKKLIKNLKFADRSFAEKLNEINKDIYKKISNIPLLKGFKKALREATSYEDQVELLEQSIKEKKARLQKLEIVKKVYSGRKKEDKTIKEIKSDIKKHEEKIEKLRKKIKKAEKEKLKEKERQERERAVKVYKADPNKIRDEINRLLEEKGIDLKKIKVETVANELKDEIGLDTKRIEGILKVLGKRNISR